MSNPAIEHFKNEKRKLRKEFPQLKSGHVGECLARAFGYNTYSAFLAHAKNDGNIHLEYDHDRFLERMDELLERSL